MAIDTSDLATQEMISSLGDNPSKENSDDGSTQAMELLDALNEAEEIDTEYEETLDDIEIPDDMLEDFDLDNLDTGIEDLNETISETSESQELLSETEVSSDDLSDLDLMDTETSLEASYENPLDKNSLELDTPSQNTSLNDLNENIPEIVKPTPEENLPENPQESEQTFEAHNYNKENNSTIEQTNIAIAEMEKAISTDKEINQISLHVHEAATEATRIALETAQKAQESSEKVQKAIEATFAATERAFKAAKDAGYELDLVALDTPLSEENIQHQLTQIKAKNKALKTQNQSIKLRVDALYK